MADKHYFSQLDATCHSCGNIVVIVPFIILGVLLLLFVAVEASRATQKRTGTSRAGRILRDTIQGIQRVWQQAGLRFKLKALVGLSQCMAAVPAVYNVTTPAELEEYTRWLNLLKLPAELNSIMVPVACFGSYRLLLLAATLWPIALVALFAIGSVFRQLAKADLTSSLGAGAHGSNRKPVLVGLQRTLSFTLLVTFISVPSTATTIFKTFLCDRFEYDASITRRYLQDDPTLDCDSPQYETTFSTAIVTVFIWPIGCPVFYFMVLWMSRHAIKSHQPTPLSRVTGFLYGDYKDFAFWWEPLEMCRKLALSTSAGTRKVDVSQLQEG